MWDAKASRHAAGDVLAVAAKGRAFASTDSLIARHGGLAVFEGAALAVAACLHAIAAGERSDVLSVGARLLTDAPTPAARGSAFRRPAPRPSDTFLAFGHWLEAQDVIAAPTVQDEVTMLRSVFGLASDSGIDLDKPEAIAPLLDIVLGDADAFGPALDAILDTLDEYVHFRIETSPNAAAWDDAHDELREELASDDPSQGISAALTSVAEVPEAVRRAALERTRIVAAVRPLLEWLGSGRPATASGAVRRADIQPLAALLGIEAVGVAKLPPAGEERHGPIPALSMFDLPVVAEWWQALQAADLISLLTTRVRPGSGAAGWTAESGPPLEAADVLVSAFVAMTLMPAERGPYMATFERAVTFEAMRQLANAVSSLEAEIEPGPQLPFVALRADILIEQLSDAGVVTIAEDATITVEPGLRATVASGIALMLGFRAEEG